MGVDQFFLEFFIEGLREDIRHTVRLLDPFSFIKAVEKARHQEKVLESTTKGKAQWGKGTMLVNNVGENPTYVTGHKGIGGDVSNNNNNRLFETRRAQGLCYKRGDKYYMGHQCKPK